MKYLQPLPKAYECDYCGRVGHYEKGFEVCGREFHFCTSSICFDGFLWNATGHGLLVVYPDIGIEKDCLRINRYHQWRNEDQLKLQKFVENFTSWRIFRERP